MERGEQGVEEFLQEILRSVEQKEEGGKPKEEGGEGGDEKMQE